MGPVELDEALRDLADRKNELAAVVAPELDRQVGERDHQRELVGRGELAFGIDTLQLAQERQLRLGRGGRRRHGRPRSLQ